MGEQLLNSNLTVPMVGMVENDETSCVYMKDKPNFVGDIAYIDENYKTRIIRPNEWDSSLGYPVGVVVIPKGFAPDGKTRIINPWRIPEDDMEENETMPWWRDGSIDTTVINKTGETIICQNNSTGEWYSNGEGQLPSDIFSNYQSSIDSLSYYHAINMYEIPSPYNNNTPTYIPNITESRNALRDFDGFQKTRNLITMNKNAQIAVINAIGTHENWCDLEYPTSNLLEWYLPSIGELSYLMVRYGVIKDSIILLDGDIQDNYKLWSCTDYNRNYAFSLRLNNGYVTPTIKTDDSLSVYPFAKI